MLRIDNELLQELGLGDLPMEEKDLLLSQIAEQLELRVGTRLAENMSEEQKEEFDTNYIQQGDEQGAMEWLEKNFPGYPEVVEEELGKLKEELKQQSGTIRDIIKQQQQSPEAADQPPEQPREQQG